MRIRTTHPKTWLSVCSVGVLVLLGLYGAQRLARGPAAPDVAPHPAAVAPVSAPPCPIHFRDVTETAGINFQHTDGSSGRHYIPETVTAGLAAFDYDGDGLVDLYFPNGAPLPGTSAKSPPRHALYRNLGNCQFQEVTDQAGVICTRYGMGATVADFDGDGFPDLYVSNFGPKVLYHNNGDGTFTDVTAAAGVADGDKIGAGACFLDLDGDGDLDLFVANYVRFTYGSHVSYHQGTFPEYAGPKAYPPEQFALFRNQGDGTFADVTESSGIAAHPGKGMGVVCADYDDDGDTDIFVLNDVFENFLFQNDGTGKFQEVALEAGFKYNADGMPLGSMGVDCADYDNDGRLDFFQTSYQNELPVLYRNLGQRAFEDVTLRTGAGQGSLNNVKWGCGFSDFDNDGFRDLFLAMGHLQDEIEHYDPNTSYRTKNVLLRNLGTGTFAEVSQASGIRDTAPHSARGAVFEDLDNDGAIDIVILNSRESPTVLRNLLQASKSRPHWLQLQLRGVKSNRDGVGARVRVTAGELVQIDEVHSGRGYQSHWGSRLHFGLGDHQRVERLEIRWLGGGTEVWENVAVDQILTLVEGSGKMQPLSEVPETPRKR